MEAPCLNCKERQQGCHSRCSAYQVYNNWRIDERERLSKAKNNSYDNSRASHWSKLWSKSR